MTLSNKYANMYNYYIYADITYIYIYDSIVRHVYIHIFYINAAIKSNVHI